jgi:hypothetical protein
VLCLEILGEYQQVEIISADGGDFETFVIRRPQGGTAQNLTQYCRKKVAGTY